MRAPSRNASDGPLLRCTPLRRRNSRADPLARCRSGLASARARLAGSPLAAHHSTLRSQGSIAADYEVPVGDISEALDAIWPTKQAPEPTRALLPPLEAATV